MRGIITFIGGAISALTQNVDDHKTRRGCDIKTSLRSLDKVLVACLWLIGVCNSMRAWNVQIIYNANCFTIFVSKQ